MKKYMYLNNKISVTKKSLCPKKFSVRKKTLGNLDAEELFLFFQRFFFWQFTDGKMIRKIQMQKIQLHKSDAQKTFQNKSTNWPS